MNSSHSRSGVRMKSKKVQPSSRRHDQSSGGCFTSCFRKQRHDQSSGGCFTSCFRKQWDRFTQSCGGCFTCCFRKPDEQSPEPRRGSTETSPPGPVYGHEFDDGSFEGKMEKLRKIMKTSRGSEDVGIFSRSSECEYEWLKTRLESEQFKKTVKSVRPCCITNNGFQQFLADVARCKFGILYHSNNRGRINITDVTDSLYDQELQYLSRKLGAKNVIVVIDDLKDSSEERKRQILNSQPSLKAMAEDVFLFSADEKK